MSDTPRVAILPGSFDPVTLGHADVLERAAGLFDHLIVGVLDNPDKRPMFPVAERLEMLRGAARDLELANVEVEAFSGLLVEFAARRRAAAVVRGLRSMSDFDYESQMARMNRHLAPGLETVFLAASGARSHISSRLVRDIIGHGGAVEGLVPEAVVAHLARRRAAAATRQV